MTSATGSVESLSGVSCLARVGAGAVDGLDTLEPKKSFAWLFISSFICLCSSPVMHLHAPSEHFIPWRQFLPRSDASLFLWFFWPFLFLIFFESFTACVAARDGMLSHSQPQERKTSQCLALMDLLQRSDFPVQRPSSGMWSPLKNTCLNHLISSFICFFSSTFKHLHAPSMHCSPLEHSGRDCNVPALGFMCFCCLPFFWRCAELKSDSTEAHIPVLAFFARREAPLQEQPEPCQNWQLSSVFEVAQKMDFPAQ
mmetsp:Transcript_4492/g.5343  ORF Transcript_4492/g.5343 Transcript_4492/m.5343 type:complete len:255 (-) Transcript_4492:235-999(-)